MLRRQVRLRKEYLYRKSLEDQERTIHEKKKKLKRALDEGKPIPTELRRDESELRKMMQFDDEQHDKVGMNSSHNKQLWWICYLIFCKFEEENARS